LAELSTGREKVINSFHMLNLWKTRVFRGQKKVINKLSTGRQGRKTPKKWAQNIVINSFNRCKYGNLWIIFSERLSKKRKNRSENSKKRQKKVINKLST